MAEVFFRGRKIGNINSFVVRFLKEIKIKKKRNFLFIEEN